MKLTVRQFKLLQYVNNFPELSIDDYSKALNISIPTLKTELIRLEKYLAKYHVMIQLSGKNSLQVWGKENLTHLLIDSKNILEFPLESQIVVLLILEDDFIVLQDIADRLFVSKSKIEKIMPKILKEHPNDFQSLRHYGIRCISSEVERRALFAKLLMDYFKGINLVEEMKVFHEIHFPLLDYIDIKNVEAVNNIIKIIQDNKDFSFTDESICQLFLCFLLVGENYTREIPKNVSDIFSNVIRDLPNTEIYEVVAKNIAKVIGIKEDFAYYYNEICYISYMLISLRKQNIYNTESIIEQMQDIVSEIIDTINQRLSIDLSHDDKLIKNISLHIYATVLRKDVLRPASIDCKFNELSYQYPVSFEMAVIASEIIKEYYHYNVSQNEMIYLLLHFQVAIEDLKNEEGKIKAIVICHYGMAAATLIATRINTLFGSVKIIGCYSMHDFLKLKQLKCDLILSTEKITQTDVPVIYVSPAVRENELEQVLRFIENKSVNNILKLIIMESEVLRYQKADNVEDLLSNAVQFLLDKKIVTEEYIESILKREKASPTDIGCFAVPHGNPNFVNKTKLLIISVDEGVKWNKSIVKYIFLFAVSKEDFNHNFAPLTNFYKKLLRLNFNQEKLKLLKGDDLKNTLVNVFEL